MTELEKLLNMVGAAATQLKERLDSIYGNCLESSDRDWRKFSCVYETALQPCSVARSIFQAVPQLKHPRNRMIQVLPQGLMVVLTAKSQEWTSPSTIVASFPPA